MTKARDLIKNRVVLLIIAGLILSPVPLLLSEYWLYIFSLALVYCIVALSLNQIFGFMGNISFGHALFLAVGAYGTALSMEFTSYFFAVFIGIGLSALIAAGIGYIIRGMKHIYFALITLAFGQVGYFVAYQWTSVTGGLNGFSVPNIQPILGIEFASLSNFYYVILGAALLSIGILHWINNTPFGRMLTGIRENANRMKFIGVDVYRIKWYNFILAGAFAGLAGALMAPLLGHITPHLSYFSASSAIVVMVLLGGIHSFFGPIIGAFVFTFTKNVVTGFTGRWMLFLGAILLVIVIFFPKGIVGYAKEKLPFYRTELEE